MDSNQTKAEMVEVDEALDYLNKIFHDPQQKPGTRAQAAGHIIQYWFMVDVGAALTQLLQPSSGMMPQEIFGVPINEVKGMMDFAYARGWGVGHVED